MVDRSDAAHVTPHASCIITVLSIPVTVLLVLKFLARIFGFDFKLVMVSVGSSLDNIPRFESLDFDSRSVSLSVASALFDIVRTHRVDGSSVPNVGSAVWWSSKLKSLRLENVSAPWKCYVLLCSSMGRLHTCCSTKLSCTSPSGGDRA